MYAIKDIYRHKPTFHKRKREFVAEYFQKFKDNFISYIYTELGDYINKKRQLLIEILIYIKLLYSMETHWCQEKLSIKLFWLLVSCKLVIRKKLVNNRNFNKKSRFNCIDKIANRCILLLIRKYDNIANCRVSACWNYKKFKFLICFEEFTVFLYFILNPFSGALNSHALRVKLYIKNKSRYWCTGCPTKHDSW